MKRILLLSGKQGSGKTTVSDLVKKIAVVNDFIPRVFKFAEPLYAIHDACLPVLKQYGIRPPEMTKDGELLQVLGTEYGRMRIYENVWIDICKHRVDEWISLSEKHIAIIDDCRFENEFDAFDDALKIMLSCPEEIRKSRCSYWRDNSTHPSETGLDDYVRKGKYSGKWEGIYSTEFSRPEVTAESIFERMKTGFKF